MRRTAVALVWALTIVVAGPTASIAKPPPASLHLRPLAASFLAGSTVQLTGTLSPHSSQPVVVQRLVARRWVPIAHARPATTGTFAISVRAPKSPTTWSLRAVRARSGHVKALISPVVHVRVVKTAFAIALVSQDEVTLGSPLTVAGVVVPPSPGTVQLQANLAGVWTTLATGPLTRSSTFAISTAQTVGAHELRVVKAANSKVAAGASRSLTVQVTVPALAITTTSLVDGYVGYPYAQQVVATGGVAPYSWSAAGLPAGLRLSAAGTISGSPGAVTTTQVTLTVTDARGTTSSLALTSRALLPPATGNVLHGWGDNLDGQLGNGGTASSLLPVVLPPAGIVAIAATQDSAAALRYDGTVWTWGSDGSGELGDNLASGARSLHPIQVPGLSGVTAIAAGSLTVYALKGDGTVWSWGENGFGQIGDGSYNVERDTPVQVQGLSGVTAIAAGDSSGLALRSDGSVWAWGSDYRGELGNGSMTLHVDLPAPVTGLTGVTAIAAGRGHAAALRSDGTVWAWGENAFGGLCDGSTTDRSLPVQTSGVTGVSAIAAGQFNTYALRQDGTLFACGDGSDGEIGDGNLANRSTFVPVAVSVARIGAGAETALAVLNDGTLRSWGYNTSGQLGDNSMLTRSSPVAPPGLSHVIGLAAGDVTSFAISAG